MDLRIAKMRWCAGLLLVLLVGCADPMLEDVVATKPKQTAPATRPARRVASSQPKGTSTTAQPAGDVYLVYLSAAGKAAGSVPQSPYTQIVTLKNVSPANAAPLMTWLTEPSGQGGSGDRLFLVYTDSTVQEWASRIAGLLDVPAGQTTDWATAVSSLMAVAGPRFADPVAAEKILKQLEPLCIGQADTEHRWPACMLAGRLLDEALGRPREAAGRFEQAASISLKSSPGWLVARFAQARALRSAGDRVAAKTIAGDIVQHAGGSFARTRAYHEAQQMAQAK